MTTFTAAEIAKHTTAESCWVTFRGGVYDVTKFLQDHPGGEDFILEHGGKDITSAMKGPDHDHSDSAYQVLIPLWIGSAPEGPDAEGAKANGGLTKRKNAAVAAAAETQPEDDTQALKSNGWSADLIQKTLGTEKEGFIDPHKPMLAQIWRARWTKEFYLEQVHIPKHVPFNAPIFGFDHPLEVLSKTPWWVVPLVWLPLGQGLAVTTFRTLPPTTFAAYYGFGVALWTFVEYSLHRWLFHMERLLPAKQTAYLLHFLLHGVHHFLPMDGMRLVMPPALFTILLTPVYLLLVPWFPTYDTAHATLSGALLGYVFYDMTHYYLHHGLVATSYMRAMKRWHMDHHYKNANALYGITSKFWDIIFGTTS